MNKILILFWIFWSSICIAQDYIPVSPTATNQYLKNSVIFKTSDKELQKLYDIAELKCLSNIRSFCNYKVLVEGAGYSNVWLETQPMGGEMYAKRDIAIAKNNQMIFMDHQRDDGRLPGMISLQNNIIHPHYGWLQGFCFPEPALNMYYWLNKDNVYLEKLYQCLSRFDQYLWKYRDSDGNGCLESWCVYDTGDDNSIRLDGAPLEWPYDFAPNDSLIREFDVKLQRKQTSPNLSVPMESMDVMSYSYSCREVLAKISTILNNGKTSFWNIKAQQVKNKIKSYLWDSTQSACYDYDSNNNKMNVLLNNNIRCMYYGSFDQQMADEFIARHLFNPKEFWTYMPLSSIAVKDPSFRNIEDNDWSGQSQGLTFQRAIGALENYGHYAEVIRIGNQLIKVLKQNFKFTQQYDPFSGKANNSSDGYGPTLLSLLEYISRMYGIHYVKDVILWSGINTNQNLSIYSQVLKGKKYTLHINGTKMSAYINNKLVFASSCNVRCVTDLNGKFISVIGIDSTERKIQLKLPDSRQITLNVKPNTVSKLDAKNNILK